jgi:uncharacterized membrane protein YvbJ
MNKYCKYCGKELEENATFCGNCGKEIEQINTTSNVNNISNNKIEKSTNTDEEDARIYCILSLVCTFFSGIITKILYSLNINIYSITPLCTIIGIVLMIYARVKYPKSKFAKVLMWLYLILFILGILMIIVLIICCFEIIDSCGDIGLIWPFIN